ncbi:MAG: RNA-binding S4 domain-containing protein [Rhizobiaceae bacterium]|nr:RNA-binding S4 domain-containing protein [Rhizobiaceae bacterium]
MVETGRQRIDKWLFFARVVKSRTLAAKLVESGKVRINAERVVQPAHAVKPGDGLTITLERQVLVLKVLAPGARRGPAEEARTLYENLSAPPPKAAPPPAEPAVREQGSGRPTKRERRETDQLKGRS